MVVFDLGVMSTSYWLLIMWQMIKQIVVLHWHIPAISPLKISVAAQA